MTHILVATDAWHPQVNGVVRTLTMMAEAAKSFGVDTSFLTPQSFRTIAMPSYPDLRLALPSGAKIASLIEAAKPDGVLPIGCRSIPFALQSCNPVMRQVPMRSFAEVIAVRLRRKRGADTRHAGTRRRSRPSSAVFRDPRLSYEPQGVDPAA